ncbi:MAG: phosphatase domain-containing protein, partial [Pseudobdellovibrio sp.]
MTHWKQRSTTNLDVVYFDYETKAQIDKADEVYIWDLDKTYLDTSIDSIGGLLATIFEKAFTKRNVPGTPDLIRSLSRYRKKQFNEQDFPLFFVSASPPQMESKVYEKFVIDEIQPIGMFYKDNLRNLAPKKLLFLRKQIGYKVQSLLQLRTRLSKNVRMICFGDDSESDATIYNLFSDICARRHTESQLTTLLDDLGVNYAQIDEILRLQNVINIQDPVEKVYINLATDTDPEYYLKYGRRT